MSRSNEDPLLKKARQAEERARRASGKTANVSDTIQGFSEDYAKIKAFFRLLKRYTGPLGSFVLWIAKKIGASFMWAAFLRVPDKLDNKGEPKFSFLGKVYQGLFGRAKAKALASNIFYQSEFKFDEKGELYFSKARLIKSILGTFSTIVLVHVLFSAIYFYSTQFEEYIYTSGGKEQIIAGDLYQFTGCTSLPCSTEKENGKFYQIDNSWYFPILIYPEEYVYAAIPEQDGVCHVKGYGLYFKNLKFLHHTFQWYQKVYNVTCSPLTEEEKKRVISTGAAPRLREIAPKPKLKQSQ